LRRDTFCCIASIILMSPCRWVAWARCQFGRAYVCN